MKVRTDERPWAVIDATGEKPPRYSWWKDNAEDLCAKLGLVGWSVIELKPRYFRPGAAVLTAEQLDGYRVVRNGVSPRRRSQRNSAPVS